MNQTRLQLKVGIFVLICLVLLAGLILSFRKGMQIFRPTYGISLQTSDVGGIKQQAKVLVAGLRVGSVSDLKLTPDGRSVLLELRIDRQYKLRRDSRFVIEQAGFLGDQYVAVYPQSADAPFIAEGAIIPCEEPFNMQEAARAATGFLQRIDQTARRLNEIIQRVDQRVLDPQTLSNFSMTIANLRTFSERAIQVVDRVEGTIQKNDPVFSQSVSNLARFSANMETLATDLSTTIRENRQELSSTLKNLKSTTETIDLLVKDVQAGQGLAGSLLRDDQLRNTMRDTMSNMSQLSSNLNRFGLLYRPRHASSSLSSSTNRSGQAISRSPKEAGR